MVKTNNQGTIHLVASAKQTGKNMNRIQHRLMKQTKPTTKYIKHILKLFIKNAHQLNFILKTICRYNLDYQHNQDFKFVVDTLLNNLKFFFKISNVININNIQNTHTPFISHEFFDEINLL